MIDKDPSQVHAERIRNNLVCANLAVQLAMGNILRSSHVDRDFSMIGAHRGLFTPLQSNGKIVTAPLASALFNINPETNFQALHDVIDDKRILLAGGGSSMQDLTSMDSDDTNALKPKSLVNTDPYTKDVDRSNAPYYQHVELDPTSENFLTDLDAAGHQKFDEIWGTSSVPHYCTTAEEIERFFANMYEALDAGGILRIYPLAFFIADVTDEQHKQQRTALRGGLTNALTALAQKNDIEMSTFENAPDLSIRRPTTLLIHKIS